MNQESEVQGAVEPFSKLMLMECVEEKVEEEDQNSSPSPSHENKDRDLEFDGLSSSGGEAER